MSELVETNRIRAQRGLEPLSPGMTSAEIAEQLERDRLFERVAAARCMVDTCRTEKEAKRLELVSFMAIFHPSYSEDDVRKLRSDL